MRKAKTVGFFGDHSVFSVQALFETIGNFIFSLVPVQNKVMVPAYHFGHTLYGRQLGTHGHIGTGTLLKMIWKVDKSPCFAL